MNMKPLNLFAAGMILGILIFSCSKDKSKGPDNTVFSQGVFIVDEGNYSDADGEVTFINFITGDVQHNVFKNANNRPFAGVLQSLTLFNGKGYLVDQLGRMEVVDALHFKSAGTLREGLAIPRYFAASGNTGFITDWGPYDAGYNNPHSKIVVVNLDDLTVKDTLPTGSRPEGIILSGGHIFVANSATDKVTVYNAGTYSLEKEITVTAGPVQFVTDKTGNLWVACTGSDSTSSAMEVIDPVNLEVNKTITLPPGVVLNGKIAINGTKDMVYVMSEQWSTDYSYSNNTIFKQPVDNSYFSYSSVLARRNLYGLGVDPSTAYVYVADAAAFQTNGIIYVYSDSGALLDSAGVDRGPRDFVFVNN